MSSVNVLCPNGRRNNIKVSPNTPLLTVLEEACHKHGLDPSQHALKHQRKMIDLSKMFRYSGLPYNAKLEVVTAASPHHQEQAVKVAVQLESGDRLQGVFPSTVSLWDLVTNLHGNSQWTVGEPVVVYMRREVCDEQVLKETTLRCLGVQSGSVVLRLIHRHQVAMDTSDHLSNPVIVSKGNDASVKPSSVYDVPTSDPLSHDPPARALVTSSSHDPPTRALIASSSHDPPTRALITSSSATSDVITGSSQDPTTSDLIASSSIDYTCASGSHDPPNNDSTTASIGSHVALTSSSIAFGSCDSPISDSSGPCSSGSHDLTASVNKDIVTRPQYDLGCESCDRQVVIFNVDDHVSTATPTLELPDSFFDVTVGDCVAMQRDLQQQVKKLMDAPLITASRRQAALHDRLSQYSKAVIRVVLPDHWVLQGLFRPNESMKALVKFVREHLADPTIKFYLYTAPPKTVFTSAKQTLLQAGLVPASVVYFGLHDNQVDQVYLKSSLLEQAVSPPQADAVSMTTRDKSTLHNSLSYMETPASNNVEKLRQKDMPTAKRTTSTDITTRVPKWFKHSGGKKL